MGGGWEVEGPLQAGGTAGLGRGWPRTRGKKEMTAELGPGLLALRAASHLLERCRDH